MVPSGPIVGEVRVSTPSPEFTTVRFHFRVPSDSWSGGSLQGRQTIVLGVLMKHGPGSINARGCAELIVVGLEGVVVESIILERGLWTSHSAPVIVDRVVSDTVSGSIRVENHSVPIVRDSVGNDSNI